MRPCKVCMLLKDESEFYNNPTRGGGLDALCKTCSNCERRRRKRRAQIRAYLAVDEYWRQYVPAALSDPDVR